MRSILKICDLLESSAIGSAASDKTTFSVRWRSVCRRSVGTNDL